MGKKYKNPPLTAATCDFKFIQASESESLKKTYNIRDKEKVLSFVESNPQLVELLFETIEKINIYFPDSKPILKHFTDPETTGEEHLIISIPTIYGSKETLKRLDQLEDDWWVENVYRAEGKVSINVEFK